MTVDLNPTPEDHLPDYDLDVLSRKLAATVTRWAPLYFPKGRIADGELRCADRSGRPPRKQGSFVIHLTGDNAGSWFEFSNNEGGQPLSTLQLATGLSGRALLEKAAEITGEVTLPAVKPNGSNGHVAHSHTNEIDFILAHSVPLKGTLAERYLNGRKLDDPQSSDLLYHDNLTDYDKKIGRPAMVGVIRDDTGKVVGLHRTYLDPETAGKAKMSRPRKMLGEAKKGAVRLGPLNPDGKRGVGEGIESTLAGMAYYAVPGDAALSTTGMREYQWPEGTKRLIVFADAGKAGIDAAQVLRLRAQQSGIVVDVELPQSGDDFARDREQGLAKREPAIRGPDGEIALGAVQEAMPWQGKEGSDDGPILDRNDPHANARDLLERYFTRDEWLTLLYHRDDFYWWTGTHFARNDTSAIRARLWEILSEAQTYVGKALKTFQPNSGRVDNTLDALKSLCFLPASIEQPAWLDASAPRSGPLSAPIPTTGPGQSEAGAASNYIACQNGLLHLPTLTLHPHTPAYYCHHALPFDYDPERPVPAQWQRFLTDLWEEDGQSIDTLQEIFGYIITGETRQHKAFLLVGPKRAGKGTIARVLTDLIGRDNMAAPHLRSFENIHGQEALIGKKLAVIADLRIGARDNQQAIGETLLTISGEDAVTIPRKYKHAWTGRLGVRFFMMSNETPSLADVSTALPNRFITLNLSRSFFGHEDPYLTDHLLTELPSIFNWAIAGWKRLKARGYFVTPDSSKEINQEMEELSSPVSAFVTECCVVSDMQSVECLALYRAYQDWCREMGRDHPGTIQKFGSNVRACVEGLVKRQGPRPGRKWFYYGVGLQPEFFPASAGFDFNRMD